MMEKKIEKCMDVKFDICEWKKINKDGYVGEEIESVIDKMMKDEK